MKLNNKLNYVYDNNSVSIIKICYVSKITKDEDPKRISFMLSILSYILLTSCLEYSDHKKFQDRLVELGILKYTFDYQITLDSIYIYFYLFIPNKDVIPDFNLEEAFKFFIDIIRKPYVKDGKFNLKKFKYEKDFLCKKYEASINRFYFRCSNRLYNFIDEENVLGKNYEINKKVHASITSTELYKFYESHVLNSFFVPFACGAYSKEQFQNLFDKYYKYDIKEETFNFKKYQLLKINKDKYHEESNESNQSLCYVVYQIDKNKLSIKDLHYFELLMDILHLRVEGSLFDELRIKNSLIYDIDYITFLRHGFFIIEFDISDENKDKLLKEVKHFWDNLKDEKKLRKFYEKILEELKIEKLENMDDDFHKFDLLFDKVLKFSNLNDVLKFYNKLDISDFLVFIDKIKQTNIFYLKGDKDV